jgi:hypothetical protein
MGCLSHGTMANTVVKRNSSRCWSFEMSRYNDCTMKRAKTGQTRRQGRKGQTKTFVDLNRV